MFSQPTCIFFTLGMTSICFWILANLHSNVTNIKYDGYQRMLFKSQLNILGQISFLSCLPKWCFFCHTLAQFCIITKLTRFKILPFTLAMLLWMMLWVKVNFSCPDRYFSVGQIIAFISNLVVMHNYRQIFGIVIPSFATFVKGLPW